MKIAVATDDKFTIRKGHFGEGKYYLIFEILNGRIFSEELRSNPYVQQGKHQHGNTERIMSLLKDCQIFIAKSMGKQSIKKLVENNIEVIISDIESAIEAVESYLEGKDEWFKYYDKNRDEFRSCADRQ